jgi:hypothetical protein
MKKRVEKKRVEKKRRDEAVGWRCLREVGENAEEKIRVEKREKREITGRL